MPALSGEMGSAIRSCGMSSDSMREKPASGNSLPMIFRAMPHPELCRIDLADVVFALSFAVNVIDGFGIV